MSSDKQLEANRRNALLSTGPRTDEGKAASRLNGWKHGLTGHLDVLTEEQMAARDAFLAEFSAGLNPVGAVEVPLAGSIAELHWRLSRVGAIENNLLAADADAHQLQLLTVYEARLSRRAQSELRQLLALQKVRLAEVERRKAEAERQKAADAEQRSTAFQEACWLLQLDEEEGRTIDPNGVFRHRNGSGFSNRELLENIAWTHRLAVAKKYSTDRVKHLKFQTYRSRTSPLARTPKNIWQDPQALLSTPLHVLLSKPPKQAR